MKEALRLPTNRNTGGKGRCGVCGHAQRDVIEALHVAGWSYDRLAERFDLSRQSLHRHCSGGHLTDEKRTKLLCGTAELARLKELVAEDVSTTHETLRLMQGVLFNHFLRRAENDRTFELSNVARALLEVTREVGKLRGEITDLNPALTINNTTNVAITASPQFLRLQRALMKLCLDHPTLRTDIAAMLRECEAAETHGELPALEASVAA